MFKSFMLFCAFCLSTPLFASDLVLNGSVNEVKISHYEIKSNADILKYVIVKKHPQNTPDNKPIDVINFDIKELKKINEQLTTKNLMSRLSTYGEVVKKGDTYSFKDNVLNGTEMIHYSTKNVLIVNDLNQNISENHILGVSYIDAHKFLLYYTKDITNVHTGIGSVDKFSVPISEMEHIVLTSVITESETKIIGMMFKNNKKDFIDVFVVDAVF